MASRRCSRTGCPGRAHATLTYVYADSMAVLGPLATQSDPHTYDLCERHAQRLSAPRGWEVIRLEIADDEPSSDDLLALADAVREVGMGWEGNERAAEPDHRGAGVIELGRRAHLTVLADSDSQPQRSS